MATPLTDAVYTTRLRSITRAAARYPDFGALLLFAVLVTASYGNVFLNGFAFDDECIIVRNRFVPHLDQIPMLFRTHYWAGSPVHEHMSSLGPILYRPLVMTTYALNYAIGGVHTLGYHLVNLGLHIAVSYLLFWLARRLGARLGGSLVTGALFAVHPIHTEAVTGIVGRAELMMTLGALLAVLWYWRAWPSTGRSEPRFAVLSSLAFLGALLSKEQGVVVPPLLVVADLVRAAPGHRWFFLRGAWKRYVGYVVILGLVLGLRTLLFGGVFGTEAAPPFIDNPLGQGPAAVRILTALKIAGWYLWLCVWPARLSADYSFNAVALSSSLLDPAVLAGALAWAALAALGVLAWYRRWPVVAFGVGLTAISFLPASNLLVPSGTIMAERLFYLPSAGLCLLAGAAWDRAVRSGARRVGSGLLPALCTCVLVVVLVGFAGRTAARNRDWRDTETLMQAAGRVVPGSAKVVGNLARTSSNPTLALPLFERAISIYPTYPMIDRDFTAGYGTALLMAGRVDEAIEQLELAVKEDSRMPQAYFNLGLAYARKRRWSEAEAMFRNTLGLDGSSGVAYNGLSYVLRAQQKADEALVAADEAIRRAPKLVDAHYNRGRALEMVGRVDEAIRSYRAALDIRPGYGLARERLAALQSGSR